MFWLILVETILYCLMRLIKSARRLEHLLLWQKSVVLVCEEVSTLAQPIFDTVRAKESSWTL